MLLPSARVAIVNKLIPQSADTWFYHDHYAKSTNEVSTILGVACRKVVLSDDPAGAKPAEEVWIAEDLGIVLEDSTPVAGGTSTWKATSISLSEPDPSVFHIPSGYTTPK